MHLETLIIMVREAIQSTVVRVAGVLLMVLTVVLGVHLFLAGLAAAAAVQTQVLVTSMVA